MRIAKALAIFLITFAIIFAITWVGIQIDLFFNSFLREMQPKWWYVLTSYHGPAIAWLFYRPVFLILTAIGTAIIDLVLCANFADWR